GILSRAYRAAAMRISVLFPANRRVSLKRAWRADVWPASDLKTQAKHCVPAGMARSVSSTTPVFDTATLAWLFLNAPKAISRATSSLVRLQRSIVSALTERHRFFASGE